MKKNEYILRMSLIILLTGTAGFLLSCTSRQQEKKRASSVIHPEWSRNSVIYEVNIRQYTPEGTFKAFEQHLPRLKELGVDILWLMPIHPIGEKNRKGSLGSYYSVRDYLGINPEFGTMDDFKSLVQKAHSLEMKVIIDWVTNHTSWDNNLVTEHPDWYIRDSAGNLVTPVRDWTDVVDLDFSKEGLREYMKNAMIYWIKEADVDGFRCDVADMVPIDFWNRSVQEVNKLKPVFMLAEAEKPEMHDSAFNATYSWNLFKLMRAIARGDKTSLSVDSLLYSEDTLYPADAYRMRFTTNHDENCWAGTEYELFGPAAQTFAVLTFTIPGIPMIYSGQESASGKRLRFFDKDTIVWGNYDLHVFYSTLINLKKENKALWNGSAGGSLTRLETNRNKDVYAFIREKDKNKVIVILNLTPGLQSLDIHDHKIIGNYTNLFTREKIRFEDEAIFRLKPWEYLVFYN